ncbi:MAG: hypothetical protein HYV63_19525 [Candidatus Schekmanbacteria bacterium]|nr:hypothetical protein [Candidatus Schekmanbacteria bacterium]
MSAFARSSHHRRSLALALLVGSGLYWFPSPAAAASTLVYTLSSELKKSNCANDDDNDCLDNYKEYSLAWAVSPRYYYDEDEDCAGASYTDNPNQLHYGRKDFYQVRPYLESTSTYPYITTANPVAWTATDGKWKYVHITYFLLHPHDCGGWDGHQGDSEHVVYTVKSKDLKKWYLTGGKYYHHGQSHYFDGAYLAARETEINPSAPSYPNVAGDEDAHGSWPGKSGDSEACAGDEDDFCYMGTCDCFRGGSFKGAFDSSYWGWLTLSQNTYGDRNIGGPSPERWRPTAVTISNGKAYSRFDVGHGGPFWESWSDTSGVYGLFCGWECGARASDGHCVLTVHDEQECSGSLNSKLDKTSYKK